MYNFMKLAAELNQYELTTLEIVFGAILIVAALLIIFVVLMQEGRQANVGVISGAADSFMDKGAAKSLDQKLSKWTKVIAIVFFLLVLAAMFVSQFGTNKAKIDKATEASISASIEAAKTATSATSASSATTTTTTKAPVVEDKENADKDAADQGEADTDANQGDAAADEKTDEN